MEVDIPVLVQNLKHHGPFGFYEKFCSSIIVNLLIFWGFLLITNKQIHSQKSIVLYLTSDKEQIRGT